MLKRALESGLAFLDWCWPFPLGILFGVLVLGASAASWLMFREPPALRQPPLRTNAPPAVKSQAHSEVAPPPSKPAPRELREPTVTTKAQPGESPKTTSASVTSQSDRAASSRPLTAQEAKLRDTLTRGRWYMKQGQYRAAIEEFQATLEMDPLNRDAATGLQQARDANENPKPSPQP